MDNNETMRRLRWALSLDDRDAVRLMADGGLTASPERAAAWRSRDDGAEPCPDAAVAALLDGLVRERRGPPPPGDAAASSRPVRLDNNAVLKALRIALRLRAEDVAELVRTGAAAAGGPGRAAEPDAPGDGPNDEPTLSASEVGSLLRAPGARNYRRCGDQLLRRFLAGVASRERPGTGERPGEASEPVTERSP